MFHKLKLHGFIFITIGLSGCFETANVAFAKPLAFSADEACSQIQGEGVASVPTDIMNVLEGETGEYDGFEIADAILKEASIKIAMASDSRNSCLEALHSGKEIFETRLESKQRDFLKLGESRLSRKAEIREIQKRITTLWREDQSARGVYVALTTEDKTGADYWAYRLATAHATQIDETSKRYISEILKTYEWIDRKRFGKTVSNQAWLLVQHADDYPEFQENVLSRMELFLRKGHVQKENYAFLWDRVAVNTGRKQRYGTQPDWNCVDGKMQLQPLEDPSNVNKRRSDMGLDNVEDSLEWMNKQTCKTTR